MSGPEGGSDDATADDTGGKVPEDGDGVFVGPARTDSLKFHLARIPFWLKNNYPRKFKRVPYSEKAVLWAFKHRVLSRDFEIVKGDGNTNDADASEASGDAGSGGGATADSADFEQETVDEDESTDTRRFGRIRGLMGA